MGLHRNVSPGKEGGFTLEKSRRDLSMKGVTYRTMGQESRGLWMARNGRLKRNGCFH